MILTLLVWMSLSVEPEDKLSRDEAEKILHQSLEAYTARPPVSMDYDIRMSYGDDTDPQPVLREHYIGVYYEKEDRLHYDSRFYEVKGGREELRWNNSHLWTGTERIDYPKDPPSNTVLGWLWLDKGARNALKANLESGNLLDGFSAEVPDFFAKILLDNRAVERAYSVVEADGTLSYQFEASSPYGEYRAWLSRDPPYNLRKLEITRTPDDFRDPANSYHLLEILEIDEFETIDGVTLPTKGRVERHMTRTGGKKKHPVYWEFARDNVQWNPDFDAVGAFRVDLAPNTIVSNVGLMGIKFVWTGTDFRPHVSVDVLPELIFRFGEFVLKETEKED